MTSHILNKNRMKLEKDDRDEQDSVTEQDVNLYATLIHVCRASCITIEFLLVAK